MQPRFVMERVVADLVSIFRNERQRLVILLHRRILTDDEDCDLPISFIQEVDESGDDDIQVRRKRCPTGVAVSFHVRPFILEVERQAGDGFRHC